MKRILVATILIAAAQGGMADVNSRPPDLRASVTLNSCQGTTKAILVGDELHLQMARFLVPRGQRLIWCGIDIDFANVEGWSFAIERAEIKGYAQFKGARDVRVSSLLGEHKFRHHDGVFSHAFEVTDPLRMIWSPCGSTWFHRGQPLYAITGDIDLGEVFDMSHSHLNSESDFGYHYKLKWKRCGE